MPAQRRLDPAVTAVLGLATLLWATVLHHEPPPPDDERPREVMLTRATDGRVTMGVNGRPLARQPENREALYRRLEKAYGQSPRRLTLRCPEGATLELLDDTIADALYPMRFLGNYPILRLEATDADNRVMAAGEVRAGALWPGDSCAPLAFPEEIALSETSAGQWSLNNATSALPASAIAEHLDSRIRQLPAHVAIEAHITLHRETTFGAWVRLLPRLDHPRLTGISWHIAEAEPAALTARMRRFRTERAGYSPPARRAVR